MRQVACFIAPILVLIAGCGESPRAPNSDAIPERGEVSPSQPIQESDHQGPTIPDDVSYSIIAPGSPGHTIPGIKRSLEVRLNKRVSEKTLLAIALKLKSQDPRHYDRTFMSYYLPEMKVGAGAWATTHFNPDLDVKVYGLTSEDEEKLVAEPAPANSEIIGSWLDEYAFPHRITIFRRDGRLFAEQVFTDGSRGEVELVEKKTPRGHRLANADRVSTTGDHWLLGSDGSLQIRDNEGLIATARRIETSGAARIDDAKWRTWTSAAGEYTVEAAFKSMSNGTVKLKRKDNSKTIEVPLEKLSDKDQEWIEQRRRR